MASARAPFVNYYDVLGIPQDHPQLRDALIEKQAAILTSPIEPGSATNQEQVKMILILLDPVKGPEYDHKLRSELQAQRDMALANEKKEHKRKTFEEFINDKEKLIGWFFGFSNRPDSSAELKKFEYAEMKKNPVDFHLQKRFTQAERTAVSQKLAVILAADLALMDGLLRSIDYGNESDRLEYIWKLISTFFAETVEFPTLVARLRFFILAEKFNNEEHEKTSLVYPSPGSFWLLHEIFSTSTAEHLEALNAIYKGEGFIATIKSYHKASIQPRKEPYIPTLKECFQYLPDRGDALGMMIINNQEELKKFGADESFWKNFSDAIQENARAAVKQQKDAGIIHSNAKITEYLDKITGVLEQYHVDKSNAQAALEDDKGLLSQARTRINFFVKEDGRGLQRVKILLNLFNDAINNPLRQLILMLAVLTNDDSKKLRGKMAAKVNEQEVITLLSERMRLIHGDTFTLDVPDLKIKLLDSLNEKTNHPPVTEEKKVLDHKKLFQPEMDLITQLEVTGTLQKVPEMKLG